jgi:hypothetical protein
MSDKPRVPPPPRLSRPVAPGELRRLWEEVADLAADHSLIPPEEAARHRLAAIALAARHDGSAAVARAILARAVEPDESRRAMWMVVVTLMLLLVEGAPR